MSNGCVLLFFMDLCGMYYASRQSLKLTNNRIVVSATITINIATGIKIFRKGAHLRFFLKESQHASENRDSVLTVEAAGNPFAAGKNIIVTTQIQHDVQRQHRDSGCNPYEADQGSLNSYSSTHNLSNVNPH